MKPDDGKLSPPSWGRWPFRWSLNINDLLDFAFDLFFSAVSEDYLIPSGSFCGWRSVMQFPTPMMIMNLWSSKWERLTFVVRQARALCGQVLDLTVVLIPVRSEKPPHASLSVHAVSRSSAGISCQSVMSLNMKVLLNGGGVSADATRCIQLS